MSKPILMLLVALTAYAFYCDSTYPINVEKNKVKKDNNARRSAKDDLEMLTYYFRDNNGLLYCNKDDTVKFYNTHVYRIYEFKYHTVVVFPVEWTQETLDVSIFAGHFSDLSSICENKSLFFKHTGTRKTDTPEPFVISKSKEARKIITEIKHGGIYLNQSKTELIKAQEKRIHNKYNSGTEYDKNAIENEITILRDYGHFTCGELSYSVKYVDSKVVYINVGPKNMSGIESIQLHIKPPRIIPIIDWGTIDLTEIRKRITRKTDGVSANDGQEKKDSNESEESEE